MKKGPWRFPIDLPNEEFFPPSSRCYDHWKKVIFLPIFIAAVVRETYSFIKIMQPITPKYNSENRVEQIKNTEKKLSPSCILCQLLRTKTVASGSKCIKQFFSLHHYLPYIDWIDLVYLTCLVFHKSLW